MKLTALKTFRHGSTVFRRNSPVEMSDAQAKPLLAKGLVAEAKPVSKKEEPKARVKSEGAKDE
jgi:hypothetical protein